MLCEHARKATTVVPKRYRHLSKVPKRCPARTVGHPKVIKGARRELDLLPRGARTHCWECAETRRVGTKPERQDGRGTSFRYDRSREARHLREEPERDAAGRPSRAHCHGARKKADRVPGRNWGVLEVPACYVSMLERPPQ